MKKNLFLMIAVLFAACVQAVARDGFAIVIDPKSYSEAKTEVEAYAKAIEKVNGLKVYTVIDRWGIPDSIRAGLQRLHAQKNEPIVGCVLVGDIPVAMIRDGQHMTSAFKMDQRRDRRESSVPSDRFYDDFALQFRSLGKDDSLDYFYYSVTPQSAQRTCPTIYSGRIRPTDVNGSSRYQKLRAFLRKAVAAKQAQRPLSQMLYFSGHGYISGSKVARIDEKASYYEHFPWLGLPGAASVGNGSAANKGNGSAANNGITARRNAISFIDHTDQNPIKERLMNELMRTDLDLAILHHHGYWDTEYLNGTAPIRTVREAKEFIMQNLREHVYAAHQRGKNADSISLAFQQRFDVPATWLKGALDDSVAAQDSLLDAATDLHLEDFAAWGYQPNTPVVVIDACFCGSFHQSDCIANEYIFNPGGTVAVVANTVNALQDKWSDHLVGLLGLGGVVGDLPRFSGYLESHVIGDPTYSFIPQPDAVDVDHLININNKARWQQLLKSPQPELQCLAIVELARMGAISSAGLLDIVMTSPYGIVRLQAFLSLADFNDDNYIEGIIVASQDAFELLQRMAVRAMTASGDERLIPSLMTLAIANNSSQRITFNALNALSVYPEERLMAEFARQFDSPSVRYIRKDSVRGVIAHAIQSAASRLAPEVDSLFSANTKPRAARFILRSMRNQMPHYKVPELIRYYNQTTDDELRIAVLELLGWHPNSCMVKQMREFARQQSQDTALPAAVRDEALKTYHRLGGQR